MSPIQQMLLGAGSAVASKNWIDDCFSTFVDSGTGNARTIVNNIDIADKGGLIWQKWRSGSASANDNNSSHILADTVRGTSKYLKANTNDSEFSVSAVGSFNSNGYQTGGNLTSTDNSGDKYVSYTFARQKGFFTCLTYSGSGNARTISHDLGCVPGLIIIKNLDTTDHWRVYHRSLGASQTINLNTSSTAGSGNAYFNNTEPTASVFSVGTSESTNKLNSNFIAYLFAGGESTNALARSVDFDGTNDYLSVADSDDFSFGSGAFTIEAWIKPTGSTNNKAFVAKWDNGQYEWFFGTNGDELKFAYSTNGAHYTILDSDYDMQIGQWQHIAVTRDSSSNIRFFVNGIQRGATYSASATFYNGSEVVKIGDNTDSEAWRPDAEISNVRIVKGTAVYTSSFRPSTEPLTNITNTKLLCCNNSSTTGSTTTSGTITATGSPTASTDSPFDDPAGFKFGESESENVIKCGSYVGTGSAGLEVNIGFEPQWVLIKDVSAATSWRLLDSMRGITTGGDEQELFPDGNYAEVSNDRVSLTSTGFIVTSSSTGYNVSGNTYIFCAIRRPDGYVGKPPELGTSVFGMDYSNGSSFPNFDSNFIVDYWLARSPTDVDPFTSHGRLTGNNYMRTSTTGAESSSSLVKHDSNVGVGVSFGSSYLAWMWKRHAGFDVVAYKGNSVSGTQISHSMNAVPQMIWIKRRDDTKDWQVGHHGANGGTNPWNYYLELNSTQAEASQEGIWNNTAPTSTHFTLGNWTQVNNSSGEYIAMLFSSTDVSKVGSYSGSGGVVTITTGFQPRFIMVKKADGAGSWHVFDTVRGMGSGDDPVVMLNNSNAQVTVDYVTPSSTGWSTTSGNLSEGDYIYYAHA